MKKLLLLLVIAIGLVSMSMRNECDEGDWETNFVRYDNSINATYLVQSCGRNIRLITEYDSGETEFNDIDAVTAINISNMPL